jgi:hypothetical protein
MVRQAVRPPRQTRDFQQAHGPEQSRRTHHPEPSRRAISKFQSPIIQTQANHKDRNLKFDSAEPFGRELRVGRLVAGQAAMPHTGIRCCRLRLSEKGSCDGIHQPQRFQSII